MNRKDKKSYEEIHKRLGEELENAYLKKELPEEEIPEFDLSFMDEEPKPEPLPEPVVRKHRFSRFAKVAAVVIVFLLCTNIFLLGKNSSESYGDKGILHRLYQGVTGLFTDSEEETEASDVEEFMDFDTLGEKELKKAKEFLPGLYVPTYMPEGYEFSNLEIRKYYSGDCQCDYVYSNKTNELKILLHYFSDGDFSYQYSSDGDLITLEDRKILVTEDIPVGNVLVSVYTELCNMDISGIEDKNILISIAKGMKQ